MITLKEAQRDCAKMRREELRQGFNVRALPPRVWQAIVNGECSNPYCFSDNTCLSGCMETAKERATLEDKLISLEERVRQLEGKSSK